MVVPGGIIKVGVRGVRGIRRVVLGGIMGRMRGWARVIRRRLGGITMTIRGMDQLRGLEEDWGWDRGLLLID